MSARVQVHANDITVLKAENESNLKSNPLKKKNKKTF